MVMSTPCDFTQNMKSLKSSLLLQLYCQRCLAHSICILLQPLKAIPLLAPFQGSLLCCPMAPLLVDNARHAVSSSVVHLL